MEQYPVYRYDTSVRKPPLGACFVILGETIVGRRKFYLIVHISNRTGKVRAFKKCVAGVCEPPRVIPEPFKSLSRAALRELVLPIWDACLVQPLKSEYYGIDRAASDPAWRSVIEHLR